MTSPLYARTEHVCRTCLGPILRGDDQFICAVCDAAGAEVEAICGCGLRVEGSRRPLGFKCVQNPVRSPQCPAPAIILFAKVEE
jgi:hypothetical protein